MTIFGEDRSGIDWQVVEYLREWLVKGRFPKRLHNEILENWRKYRPESEYTTVSTLWAAIVPILESRMTPEELLEYKLFKMADRQLLEAIYKHVLPR